MSGIRCVASVKLDTRGLDRLSAQAEGRAEAILDRAAFNIQGRATINTVRVDTGAMKNGWRVERSGRLQRTIYNTQDYAIVHELGSRYIEPSPMLVPAVEAERRPLEQSWAALFRE